MDYGRRNRTAFRIQVEKGETSPAFELITGLLRGTEPNKAKHGTFPSLLSNTGMDDLCPPRQNSNHMNNSLMSLYRKGNPEDETPSREGSTSRPHPASQMGSAMAEHAEAGSARRRPATAVSAGGWFIDKAGSRDEESILIDLCEEESGRPAINVALDRASPVGHQTAPYQNRTRTKGPDLQHSTVKFDDIGGNEETLTELCKLLIHMRHPEVYQQLGVVPPRGFLLHGPPGCGKTLLAQAVAGEMELPMLKVSAPELVSGVSGESEQKLRELFEHAVSNAPCILFIDEIDAITPKREVASKDMERRIVAQLLTCMDDLNSLSVPAQVLVIGATNRPDSLDPALRRAGRFDREICLGIPDEDTRLTILKTLCRKLKLPADFDFRRLARLTPGYVGADLMALCREAAMSAVNRVLRLAAGACPSTRPPVPETEQGAKEESNQAEGSSAPASELPQLLALLKNSESLSEEQLASLCIIMDDFRASLTSVQPSAKREGFATVPDVTWDDVGALQDIREELTMAILAPVRNPEQFRALGLSAPAGVLLAGPPGCGKTLLAKAVANESGLNFISVKGPELLNMYVGESERAVRQVFQRGRNSAPCVIFFDEIDALCPRRSGHESGSSVRVVNQLLTEMDGLEARRQVFIMAATNRPDIIDPAVLRPGRLDKTLYVGLPPSVDRHAILLTITKGGTKPHLESDVSLEEIASDERCDYFTGADLSALVREASVNALRAHLCARTSLANPGNLRVSKQNFEEAFKKVRPSVSKKVRAIHMIEEFKQYNGKKFTLK
uniref:AAA+ ATPase domain-containing protein n=1 Tax=Electrophorus electricus TaxID=8005 RepID=A0AAY5F3R8_ELEEL